MGSSVEKSKYGGMTGSRLPKVGMAAGRKNNASMGTRGGSNTSYSNMKK